MVWPMSLPGRGTSKSLPEGTVNVLPAFVPVVRARATRSANADLPTARRSNRRGYTEAHRFRRVLLELPDHCLFRDRSGSSTQTIEVHRCPFRHF